MTKLASFATAWGPLHGGINAFNEDFLRGLARVLGNEGQVHCIVPNASDDDVATASGSGVHLIQLGGTNGQGALSANAVAASADRLAEVSEGAEGLVWIGHDVVSGAAAIEAARRFGGMSALIMHMSYADYQSVKSRNSVDANRKHVAQKSLFSEATSAALFAVGPLLRRACEELTGRKVKELIPGFAAESAKVMKSPSADDEIRAITFGRMDRSDDAIKNGRLAARAFGRAISEAQSSPAVRHPLKSNPRLSLIGLSTAAEEMEVRALVSEAADRTVNVFALPFSTDRMAIQRHLTEANLAMMLSWHEGFGLTGWEAIAFRIPLLTSKRSGVYEVVSRLGSTGLATIGVLDIRGPARQADDFHPLDVNDVATAIRSFAESIPDRKRDAIELRKRLVRKFGCTWDHTARAFLAGIPGEPRRSRSFRPAKTATAKPSAPAPDPRQQETAFIRLVDALFDGRYMGYEQAPRVSWQMIPSYFLDLPDAKTADLTPNMPLAEVAAHLRKCDSLVGAIAGLANEIRREWSAIAPATRLVILQLAEEYPSLGLGDLRTLRPDEQELAALDWSTADILFEEVWDEWKQTVSERGFDFDKKQISWQNMSLDVAFYADTLHALIEDRIRIDLALAHRSMTGKIHRVENYVRERARRTYLRVLDVVNEISLSYPNEIAAMQNISRPIQRRVDPLIENPLRVKTSPNWIRRVAELRP